MSYTTQQDILDFVEDNNVKFVRFAFCDIFGTQKNIAVLAGDLPKALEDGVCFDGSSIAGFMKVEESDLVLRPDLSTVTILPWRPTEGRVMQFFCDVEKPDGAPFGGNCRGFLRQMSRKFRKLGLTCNVGAECEFYLFENDDHSVRFSSREVGDVEAIYPPGYRRQPQDRLEPKEGGPRVLVEVFGQHPVPFLAGVAPDRPNRVSQPGRFLEA